MGTDKVVIVVKDGMVWEVFGACPYKFDVEILDMDFNGADPDAENPPDPDGTPHHEQPAQRPQDRPEQKCAGDRRFRQRQDPVLCEAQPHAVRVQGLPDLIRDY